MLICTVIAVLIQYASTRRTSCRARSRADRRHAEHAGCMMQRVLLIGCGDVALRVAQRLRHRARLVGLTRNRDDVRKLRAHGLVPLAGDLDDRRTLDRLRTAPFAVLHLAPPPSDGRDDPRTRHLLAALASARIIPRHLVYISTSGVYGDCAASPPKIDCAPLPCATVSCCRYSAHPASMRRRGCRSSG